MGSSASKYEKQQQKAWSKVCRKTAPPVDQATALPHFRDLHISGYGANGISAVPELNWPATFTIRIPAVDLYDIQLRFTVDRLRFNNVSADTLNELFTIYAQCPHAGVNELHFVRSETDRIDRQKYVKMIKMQQTRSSMVDVTDSENILRIEYTRLLGEEGKMHQLYFVGDEIVYEQTSARVDVINGHANGSAPFDYLPIQDGSNHRPGGIHAEKENWKNLRIGQQPPFRLYYPDLQIEVVGTMVKITPDSRWTDWLKVHPNKVGNYMQYVDAESVTIWCRKISETTSKTLAALIGNLKVSQCLLRARRVTFTGGDYQLIDQVMFMDFLEPRKQYLEWIGFDKGCIRVDAMRAALNSIYNEEKVRPDQAHYTTEDYVYQ